MLFYFISFISSLSLYIGLDYLLSDKVQGKYYLVHYLNNMVISYLTSFDVYHSIIDLHNFYKYPMNYNAITLTFALHFYHIIWYYKKLRFDDWLHHILMVCLALPLSLYIPCGSLLGYSLFFLTGLPGGIDYLLLFMTRNNYLNAITEKKINNYLNLWIRAPGCISHSTLSLVGYFILKNNNVIRLTLFEFICFSFVNLSIFWNGIYFMNQVVINYNMNKIH
jgi:hypothetical protein